MDAFGEGLQRVGGAVASYAEEQDKLDAAVDSAGARTLDVEAMARLNTIRQQFQAQRGLNAGAARGDTEKAITDLREELMAKAGTPRMKETLANVLDQRIVMANESIADHVRVQSAAAEDTASIARQAASFDTAVLAKTDEERAINLKTGLDEIAIRGQRLGLGQEAIVADQRKFASGVHTSVVRDMIDGDNVDGALAYQRTNQTAFTAEDDERLDKMLRDPLQSRMADSDLTRGLMAIRGSTTPATATPEVAGPKQDSIRSAAAKLGISPIELAAIASFEGRLNPRSVGGDGGRYEGMFQFGPEERRKYGIDRNSSFEDQVNALVRFATDRGFKPGMGWKKLYTTINAGNPHAPTSRRDSNGSQNDHYSSIEKSHFSKAQSFLGGEVKGGEVSSAADVEALDGWLRTEVSNGNMSPERADRVRSRAQQQVSLANAMRQQSESEATRAAYDVIDKLPGNRLTNMNQLPAEVRSRLPSTARMQLEEEIARNNAPKPIEANGSVVAVYNRMAAENPEAFVGTDLRAIRGQVTPSEWDTLFTLQGRLKANPRGGEWVSHSELLSVVNRNATYIGLDLSSSRGKFNSPDDAASAQTIVAMMQADLNGVTGGKRSPTKVEIDAAFDRATMSGRMVKPGMLWGENKSEARRFEAYGPDGKRVLGQGERFEYDVPKEARARIIQSIRTATGNPRYNPTANEIGEVYMRHKGTPGYWQ
ncbi:MAG: hypothetical protein ACRCYS_04070 [Beijerinckiaceae bacterium]